MNTTLEPQQPDSPITSRSDKSAKPKNAFRYFLISWIILIALGVAGSVIYTDYLKRQIEQNIAAQTNAQLQQIQADYEQQLRDLQDSVAADMANIQSKVDALNELLAFTRDSASDKTDNSNQLYTQLAEVKAQLDELKKNLDVLK